MLKNLVFEGGHCKTPRKRTSILLKARLHALAIFATHLKISQIIINVFSILIFWILGTGHKVTTVRRAKGENIYIYIGGNAGEV